MYAYAEIDSLNFMATQMKLINTTIIGGKNYA